MDTRKHRWIVNTGAGLFAALALSMGLPGPASAQDDTEPLERLRSVARAAVAAQAAPTARIEADALDPRLRLPACAEAPLAQVPAQRAATVTVALRCDAPVQWTVHVPVRVRDLRPILVLKQPVRAGEIAGDEHFIVQERDVATLPFGHLDDPDALRGRQFRRALAAGAAPAPADLEAPRWVQRGQPVQIRGRAGGIEVRAEGKALADGAAGHRVRVENRGSRRVVEGVVAAPGVVEVAL
ncbi:MAG TPA: flagellar basal body P-ring formation chaperone FlgA [Solimonas sp.]